VAASSFLLVMHKYRMVISTAEKAIFGLSRDAY